MQLHFHDMSGNLRWFSSYATPRRQLSSESVLELGHHAGKWVLPLLHALTVTIWNQP
jgi:hypothetical protein